MALFWCGSSILMTLLFFFDDRPDDRRARPAPTGRRGGHMRKLFLSGNFVKIGLAIFLLMGAVSAFMLHLSPALVDNGFSREAAAAMAGIGGGLGGIVGKLGIGWLFDRLRLNVVTLGMTAALAVACILMALGVHQIGAAMLACLVMGAAGGAILTISACLTTRFFPPEDFGFVYGGLGSVMAMCTAIGPVSASLIHDQVGSYVPAFWAGVAIAVVSTALIASLTPVQVLERPAADPVEAY
jgi:predicted MFS family arabinose efflux permease